MDFTPEEKSISSHVYKDYSGKDFPSWNNEVKISGVYRLDYGLFEEGFCPECEKEITQYQVTLIYASEPGIRLAYAPCAWICLDCKVALVDENMASYAGRREGFKYYHPLALLPADDFYSEGKDEHEKSEPSLFSHYEGRKMIHVLDEEEGRSLLISDSKFSHFMREETGINRKAEKRIKVRKLQKKARKRNRKK